MLPGVEEFSNYMGDWTILLCPSSWRGFLWTLFMISELSLVVAKATFETLTALTFTNTIRAGPYRPEFQLCSTRAVANQSTLITHWPSGEDFFKVRLILTL
jgi:hypothetical protein